MLGYVVDKMTIKMNLRFAPVVGAQSITAKVGEKFA